MAVVLASAQAGVALLGRRRRRLWALLTGVLFAAAGGMKVVHLPTALLGLGLSGYLTARQLSPPCWVRSGWVRFTCS
jgi:hypothetical protein